MQFKKEKFLKILLRAFNNENNRITEFENEPRDFLHYVTQKELDLNEYRKIRRNKIWYVAVWIQFGYFPDEINKIDKIDEKDSEISYKEYQDKYLKSPYLCIEDESVDLISIFEDQMLEDWKQKLEETQTITLETKG